MYNDSEGASSVMSSGEGLQLGLVMTRLLIQNFIAQLESPLRVRCQPGSGQTDEVLTYTRLKPCLRIRPGNSLTGGR